MNGSFCSPGLSRPPPGSITGSSSGGLSNVSTVGTGGLCDAGFLMPSHEPVSGKLVTQQLKIGAKPIAEYSDCGLGSSSDRGLDGVLDGIMPLRSGKAQNPGSFSLSVSRNEEIQQVCPPSRSSHQEAPRNASNSFDNFSMEYADSVYGHSDSD